MGIAASDLQNWESTANEHLAVNVTVNCSSGEFRQPQFRNDLLNTILTSGVNPARLSIEVTESTLMQNPEAVRQIMNDLRATGIRIGIDDFGTDTRHSLISTDCHSMSSRSISRSFVT